MDALNAVLQLLLVLAVFCFFGGFIAPPGYRLRLFAWAVKLVLVVFLVALLVVEVRAHPLLAALGFIGTSGVAFGILEVRRRLGAHRPPSLPFMSLRTTGKTAVEIGEDHPFNPRDEDEEEA